MKTLEELKIERNILCIDFKSYYATVECISRGLDPLKTKLCVADEQGGDGAIVLALTPYLKQLGYKGRPRLYELRKEPGLIIAKPQMQKYIDTSIAILKIYLNYFEKDDIYIYSIDEAFLDVTNYLKLYQLTDYEIAKQIMNDVYLQTKILSTCGIGPNMLMAKLALDIESKHNQSQIAKWSYNQIDEKLWPIKDLTKMWSIGANMAKRLYKMGYYQIGDIALGGVEPLKREFGIIGEELYLHVFGIDRSLIQNQKRREMKSIGRGHTLKEDYYNEQVLTVFKELAFEMTMKLIKLKLKTSQITISYGYSRKLNIKSYKKTIKIDPTNDYRRITQIIMQLVNSSYVKNMAIRKISISYSELKSVDFYQTNLFDKVDKKQEKLDKTLLELREKFGVGAINISESSNKEAISKKRSHLIGGHNA